MNNIVVVYFTNEVNFGLAELAVKRFKRYSTNLPIHIVSNSITKNYNFYNKDVIHHNMDIPFSSTGAHFGESMIKYLSLIDYEYIFFFCDDYFLLNDVKENDLAELLNFIKSENIDYFGFDDMAPGCSALPVRYYESNSRYNYTKNFIIRNPDERYLYSVQPCIWKKESLLKVLSKGTSLHNLDETLQEIKDIKGITALGNDLPSHMTYKSKEEVDSIDYFILSYVEIVRHGVFIVPENNPNRVEEEIQTAVVRDICNTDNLNRFSLHKFLYNLKL